MSFLQPIGWVVLASIVLAVALLLTVRTEWRKPALRGARRWWVLLFNVLAAVSLWGLLTEPATEQVERNDVTLVTAGATASQLDAIEGEVFVMADSGVDIAGATVIADLQALQRAQPNADVLTVLGHGLERQAWIDGLAREIVFDPPPIPDGLVDLQHASRVMLGDAVQISARYHGAVSDEARWALKGASGVELDSGVLGEGGVLEAQYRPKTLGGALLSLVVEDSDAVLANEPVPVWVDEAEKLNVLMKLSRPSFEGNAIKQFLLDSGADVTVQVTLSREIRRVELAGDGQDGGTGLSLEALSELDVLVVNAAGLQAMGSDELVAIEQAMADGLGVLVLVDEVVERSGVMPFALAGDGQEATVFQGALEVSAVAGGLQARAAEGVVRSDSGAVLVAVRGVGNGKVAASLMGDSFAWRMMGDDGGQRFGEVWGEVVEKVGRVRVADEVIRRGAMVKVGERVEVCGAVDGERGVRECVGVWGEREGWSEEGVYVVNEGSWGSDEVVERQRGTEGMVGRVSSGAGVEERRVMRGVIGSVWWWGVFVLGAGGVWGSRKGWG